MTILQCSVSSCFWYSRFEQDPGLSCTKPFFVVRSTRLRPSQSRLIFSSKSKGRCMVMGMRNGREKTVVDRKDISSVASLLRPCRVCRRVTNHSPRLWEEATKGKAVYVLQYCVAPIVACRLFGVRFAWEMMPFRSRARRCGTSQTLSSWCDGPAGSPSVTIYFGCWLVMKGV
jgi:hypothetical protein